jgi:hypothetical protein
MKTSQSILKEQNFTNKCGRKVFQRLTKVKHAVASQEKLDTLGMRHIAVVDRKKTDRDR